MSLASCPDCWDDACCCPSGGSWRRHGRESLLEIRAAIDAALAAGPLPVEPRRPVTREDWGRTITISLEEIE